MTIRFLPVVLLLGTLAGCSASRGQVQQNLMNKSLGIRTETVADSYRVGYPDVLELVVATRSEFDGRFPLEPDGRIPLADYGRLRVEGLTTAEIADRVAKETGVESRDVRVRVLEYKSQYVTLFGEVLGSQRPIAYQGSETVLDLLKRVGGITPEAAPDQVYVIRTHLDSTQRSDVFHVDLHAIVMKNDMSTNVRLMPFDQIYVGESRQAKLSKSIPNVLKPVYHAVTGGQSGQATRAVGQWRLK